MLLSPFFGSSEQELEAQLDHIRQYKKAVFKDYESISSILVLKEACTPQAILKLGAEGINQIWRDVKLRAVGIKRAKTLCNAAEKSIGQSNGIQTAEYEMRLPLADYDCKMAQYNATMAEMERLCQQIPESEKQRVNSKNRKIYMGGFNYVKENNFDFFDLYLMF